MTMLPIIYAVAESQLVISVSQVRNVPCLGRNIGRSFSIKPESDVRFERSELKTSSKKLEYLSLKRIWICLDGSTTALICGDYEKEYVSVLA